MKDPINTWDQLVLAGGDQVGIFYVSDTGRGSIGSRWSVYRLIDGREVMTDPKAAWYDHGRKSFMIWFPIRAHKLDALGEALAWVRVTYPHHATTVFVRNRAGDWVPEAVNQAHPIRRRP